MEQQYKCPFPIVHAVPLPHAHLLSSHLIQAPTLFCIGSNLKS
jgi:hypothetical protein